MFLSIAACLMLHFVLTFEQVKKEMDRPILENVHSLYHELGIHDLTVQTDYA